MVERSNFNFTSLSPATTLRDGPLSNHLVDPFSVTEISDCLFCSPQRRCIDHDPSFWQELRTSRKDDEATRQERQEMEVETDRGRALHSQRLPFTKTACGLIQNPLDPYRAHLLHPMGEPLFTYPGDSSLPLYADNMDQPDTGDVHEAAGILYNGTMNHDSIYSSHRPLQPAAELSTDLTFVDLMSEPVHIQESFPAYAKLVLGDGDYYVTTHDVTIGRNMEAYKEYLRADKAQQDAQAALHDYRQEPSMPSQPGDQVSQICHSTAFSKMQSSTVERSVTFSGSIVASRHLLTIALGPTRCQFKLIGRPTGTSKHRQRTWRSRLLPNRSRWRFNPVLSQTQA